MNGEDEAADHTYNHHIWDTFQLVSQTTASLLLVFYIPPLRHHKQATTTSSNETRKEKATAIETKIYKKKKGRVSVKPLAEEGKALGEGKSEVGEERRGAYM